MNMKKLNDDLQSIHSVMRKTIDDVLDRGNKLEDVADISKNIAEESKRYKWGAKKLSTMVCNCEMNKIQLLVLGVIILYGYIDFTVIFIVRYLSLFLNKTGATEAVGPNHRNCAVSSHYFGCSFHLVVVFFRCDRTHDRPLFLSSEAVN